MSGLRERGFFVCVSTFPAVPVNKPSMRFTISRHNSFADIRDLVNALAGVTARRLASQPTRPTRRRSALNA